MVELVVFCSDTKHCSCDNCFSVIAALNHRCFKKYEEEGLYLQNGAVITPGMVLDYYQACNKIFSKHHNLKPRTLQEICIRKIWTETTLHSKLLPKPLRKICNTYVYSPFTEWTIPGILAKHVGYTLKFRTGYN